jgi:hypothetical protein
VGACSIEHIRGGLKYWVHTWGLKVLSTYVGAWNIEYIHEGLKYWAHTIAVPGHQVNVCVGALCLGSMMTLCVCLSGRQKTKRHLLTFAFCMQLPLNALFWTANSDGVLFCLANSNAKCFMLLGLVQIMIIIIMIIITIMIMKGVVVVVVVVVRTNVPFALVQRY